MRCLEVAYSYSWLDIPWYVCLSVCLLVTTMSSAKTAEPLDMLRGIGVACAQTHALDSDVLRGVT